MQISPAPRQPLAAGFFPGDKIRSGDSQFDFGEVVDVIFNRVLETTVRFFVPALSVCAGCLPDS